MHFVVVFFLNEKVVIWILSFWIFNFFGCLILVDFRGDYFFSMKMISSKIIRIIV